MPDHSARALRPACSGDLHDVTNPLYAPILKGAQRAGGLGNVGRPRASSGLSEAGGVGTPVAS